MGSCLENMTFVISAEDAFARILYLDKFDQFGQELEGSRCKMRFWVNRRTDYAIRVVLGLARYPEGTRVAAERLSREMLIPLPMLYRLLKPLARAGLVRTYPGAGGGLELARSPERITLWDVITAVEQPPQVSECVEYPEVCPFAPTCPVRRRWLRLQRILREELESTTFAQLAAETAAVQTP